VLREVVPAQHNTAAAISSTHSPECRMPARALRMVWGTMRMPPLRHNSHCARAEGSMGSVMNYCGCRAEECGAKGEGARTGAQVDGHACAVQDLVQPALQAGLGRRRKVVRRQQQGDIYRRLPSLHRGMQDIK
jgi:hypothetical protein